MREAIRDLMDATLKDIVLIEGFARELAEMAYRVGLDDGLKTVDAMRAISRHHQVNAIKRRAELASLTEQYVRAFNQDALRGNAP